MGLFVFLLIVEMLLELRLIRKYSRFQLPEEVDFLTKVAFNTTKRLSSRHNHFQTQPFIRSEQKGDALAIRNHEVHQHQEEP